jgi:hypothetical protein
MEIKLGVGVSIRIVESCKVSDDDDWGFRVRELFFGDR